MERAIFPEFGSPWPDNRTWSRVYVGSDYCPWLIPAAAGLARALEEAGRRGWNLTLVTPYLCNETLGRVALLLEGVRDSGLELVVNDFGLACLAREREWTFPLSLGRLLVKGSAEGGREGAQGGYLAATSLDSPGLEAFLVDMGFGRVEIDSPLNPADGHRASGLPLSLHYPYRLVTLASRCPWRFTGRGWRTDPCPRSCLGGGFVHQRIEDGLEVVFRGCAQLIRYALPPEADVPGVDRLVYHPDPETRR